tara:strand:- start:3139 stop:3291 length:153 start_codon:yes stop_codon:yes gene_type:complete
MGRILREMGSGGEVKGSREKLEEAPIENCPNTSVKGVSDEVSRGSNPTST